MTKALGTVFAEAMAEFTHKEVRKLWGFGKDEKLSNQDLIKEKSTAVFDLQAVIPANLIIPRKI